MRKGSISQQLDESEAEHRERFQTELLERFYEEVGRNVVLAAQMTPYEKWPDLLKAAFKHVGQGRRNTMMLALDRLPK